MKEPWKKTCNGKVIITLNDEKTAPTEVEVPVDLNWTNRSEKKCSAPKAIILVGVVLLVGLTIVTLFKIQNLVYSTSYINWRMQELESAVSDNNDDVKFIKYKMSLDGREDENAAARLAKSERLIATIGGSVRNNEPINSQDLKLAETHSYKVGSNFLISDSEKSKNSKDVDAPSSGDKNSPTEHVNGKVSESAELNDGRDHPNPTDSEEWIKPLVETFDIFGNQPIEDHFVQNVLMKLLIPENNFEVLELNKMQEANNAANSQESENQKLMFTPIMHNVKENQVKQIPPAIENIMKSMLPSVSNFKIFHLNDKPEQAQESSMEEEIPPKMPFQNIKVKQAMPPFDGIVKSLLPPSNMKIFQFNDKPEQNSEEDMPKITIQSIKLKLLPLPPQEEFSNRRDFPLKNLNNNFEMIRLHESPEPSQEVEAPKMPMPVTNFSPFPLSLTDILMKTIMPSSKNIEIIPLSDKSEEQRMMHQPIRQPQEIDLGMNQKFNPLPIPLQDMVMKTLMPPPNQNAESHYNNEAPDQSSQEIEVTKIPIHSAKMNPFLLPIPEILLKSLIPVGNYGELMTGDNNEEVPQHEQQEHQSQTQPSQEPQQPSQQQEQQQKQPEEQQPQQMEHVEDHQVHDIQPQQQAEQQPLEQQPEQQPQQETQQQPEELPKPMARSTKLNPVDVPWNMSPPPQHQEPVQN